MDDEMAKLIGYARVSTRQQDTDRQEVDLLAAGVRHDDLYVVHGALAHGRRGRPSSRRSTPSVRETPLL